MSASSSMPISFVLQAIGAEQVKSQLGAVGSATTQMGSAAEAAAQKTASMAASFKTAALGMSTAATGAFALWSQFDNLEKIETRIASAEKEVTSARATLLGSQRALAELQSKGVTSGEQFEQAQLRVEAAEKQVQIATERLSQAQGDLSAGYAQFALSVVPTTIGTVTTMTSAFKGFNVVNALTTLGLRQTHAAALVLNPALGGTAAASTAAAGGMRTLGLSLKALALNPFTIALVGATAFMTLFATNAFGMRDAINAAGKAIGDAVPILRPLLDALSSLANTIFPDATASVSDYQLELEKLSATTDEVALATGNTTDEIKTLEDYLKSTTLSTARQRAENTFYLLSIGAITDAVQYSNEQLRIMADIHREKEQAAYSERLELVRLAESQIGLGNAVNWSTEQLRNLVDSMEQYREKTKEAEAAVNSLAEAHKRQLSRLSSGEDIFERARRSGLIGENAEIIRSGPGRISTIERHATGGIISEPTLMMGLNSGRLGIMGEAGAEAIVPLQSRPTGTHFVGGGGTKTVNVHITVNGDVSGEELVRKVGRAINRNMLGIT